MSPSSSLLLIDPSLLLSEEGLSWLEADSAGLSQIILSRALVESITGQTDVDLSPFLAPEDRDAFPERRQRLASLVENVALFSYRDVDLPRAEATVINNLLEDGDSAAKVLADEWAFLVSQSWMAAKLHYVLDKFRDADAVIVEYGRRLRDEMISAVIREKNVPEVLTRGFLLKVEVKWLAVGGLSAGAYFLFPPLALAGPFTSPVIRAFDP